MSLAHGNAPSENSDWNRHGDPPVAGTAPGPLLAVKGLGKALVALLWANIGIAVVTAFAQMVVLLWLTNRDSDGLDYALHRPLGLTVPVTALGIASTLLTLAIVVVWIVWQYRATRNVQVWGVGMRRGTGWAIAGWLVPIVSLWFPAQGMHDLMRGSRPDASSGSLAGYQAAEPLIGWWWFSYLATRISAAVGAVLTIGAVTNSDWLTPNRILLVSHLPAIAAGLLAIRIVTLTTERQEQRMEAARAYWGSLTPQQ